MVADLADDESGFIHGVAVDASGTVFVSFSRTGEVQQFVPGGAAVQTPTTDARSKTQSTTPMTRTP